MQTTGELNRVGLQRQTKKFELAEIRDVMHRSRRQSKSAQRELNCCTPPFISFASYMFPLATLAALLFSNFFEKTLLFGAQNLTDYRTFYVECVHASFIA